MISFILRRLLNGFFVLLGVVVIVFLLFIGLGNPAQLTMGQRSDVSTLASINHEFGLDKSKPEQLLYYLKDLSPMATYPDTKENMDKYNYARLFHLSSGEVLVLKFPYLRRSYSSQKKVSEILLGALPNTIILALAAFLISTFFGILFGVVSAVRKYSVTDTVLTVGAILGVSIPSFFAAILIAWIFGFVLSHYTGLDMWGSLYSYDTFRGRYLNLRNLILPAIALGIRPLAIITQLTRSSMLDVLGQDYVRTAEAKGLSRREVVIKHALRNALNPVLTAVSGWLASLLAGAYFIEFIFGWRGIGKVTVDALMTSDFPVVMGSVLLVATIFVCVNILTDILYGFLDPKVRLG